VRVRAFAWTPADSQIFRLAIPALGSLAAGPLYVLTDTAIIGHLGTAPLAGLALAGVLLDAILSLAGFLEYATTAHVGRQHGAGQELAVRRVAAQALWTAAAIGGAVLVAGELLGPFAMIGLGGSSQVVPLANVYLRIALIGLPFALIANAGEGYLRGLSDLRTPLVFIVGGNVLNVVLEVLFIYGLGWGLGGSAWATVIAQAAMGSGFIVRLWRDSAGERRPKLADMRPLLRTSWQLFVRTAALYVSFLAASSVLAHVGATSLAAHQVLFQEWLFLSLVLDSVAIAGQVLISRALGVGDRDGAIAAAKRMIGWSVAAGGVFALALFALEPVLPLAFTTDPGVLDRVHAAWPVFALMQPLNGAAFALDGILIGAGDSRFLMGAMLVSSLTAVPIALAALFAGWGIFGVWLALLALIVVRTLTTGRRFLQQRWVVTGAFAQA
jgi:putative MATE family efflux protein